MSDERVGAQATLGALLGDDGTSRASTCAWCRSPVQISGAVCEIARAWNRLQMRAAERGQVHEKPLQYSELALCEPCYRRRDAYLVGESARDHETRRFYIAQLKEGTYTADSLLFLRTHGCGELVEAELARLMLAPEKRDSWKKKGRAA